MESSKIVGFSGLRLTMYGDSDAMMETWKWLEIMVTSPSPSHFLYSQKLRMNSKGRFLQEFERIVQRMQNKVRRMLCVVHPFLIHPFVIHPFPDVHVQIPRIRS